MKLLACIIVAFCLSACTDDQKTVVEPDATVIVETDLAPVVDTVVVVETDAAPASDIVVVESDVAVVASDASVQD